ncbi:MAG TPA: hypothetical protein VGM92_03995, partial [Candidatus Kapabacteria bacterium]
MQLRTTLVPPDAPDDSFPEPGSEQNGHSAKEMDAPIEGLRTDALKQHSREEQIKVDLDSPHGPTPISYKVFHLIELIKSRKITRILIQIWQSDYSIIAFVLVVVSFYAMKNTRYPPV